MFGCLFAAIAMFKSLDQAAFGRDSGPVQESLARLSCPSRIDSWQVWCHTYHSRTQSAEGAGMQKLPFTRVFLFFFLRTRGDKANFGRIQRPGWEPCENSVCSAFVLYDFVQRHSCKRSPVGQWCPCFLFGGKGCPLKLTNQKGCRSFVCHGHWASEGWILSYLQATHP